MQLKTIQGAADSGRLRLVGGGARVLKHDLVHTVRSVRAFVELGPRGHAERGDLGGRTRALVAGVHGTERKVATRPDSPEAIKAEDFAIGVHPVNTARISDERRNLRAFVGIVVFFLGVEEELLFEHLMCVQKCIEHLGTRMQAGRLNMAQDPTQHFEMRGAAGQPDKRVTDMNDLVVGLVVARQSGFAEGHQRIRTDGNAAVLFHNNNRGHRRNPISEHDTAEIRQEAHEVCVEPCRRRAVNQIVLKVINFFRFL